MHTKHTRTIQQQLQQQLFLPAELCLLVNCRSWTKTTPITTTTTMRRTNIRAENKIYVAVVCLLICFPHFSCDFVAVFLFHFQLDIQHHHRHQHHHPSIHPQWELESKITNYYEFSFSSRQQAAISLSCFIIFFLNVFFFSLLFLSNFMLLQLLCVSS